MDYLGLETYDIHDSPNLTADEDQKFIQLPLDNSHTT